MVYARKRIIWHDLCKENNDMTWENNSFLIFFVKSYMIIKMCDFMEVYDAGGVERF